MNFKFYVKRFLLSLFLVLASTMLYAQKKADITGTVYDSDGTTPAVGCAVTIEGTPTGVITDINGKYKIRGGEMMCTPKFGLINNSDSMSSVLYRAHVV